MRGLTPSRAVGWFARNVAAAGPAVKENRGGGPHEALVARLPAEVGPVFPGFSPTPVLRRDGHGGLRLMDQLPVTFGTSTSRGRPPLRERTTHGPTRPGPPASRPPRARAPRQRLGGGPAPPPP